MPRGAKPTSPEYFLIYPRAEVASAPKRCAGLSPCSLANWISKTLNSRVYFRRAMVDSFDSHDAVRPDTISTRSFIEGGIKNG